MEDGRGRVSRKVAKAERGKRFLDGMTGWGERESHGKTRMSIRWDSMIRNLTSPRDQPRPRCGEKENLDFSLTYTYHRCPANSRRDSFVSGKAMRWT